MLGLALAQQRPWLDAGHAAPVAVNLSTRCLLDAGLPDLAERLLTEHRVPAHLLRLEVTESAVMGDAARCMEVLERLHGPGRLPVDRRLRHRLPVDELKIDRSCVRDRAPIGRLHSTGTETATFWHGYMDGAITSGRRAPVTWPR